MTKILCHYRDPNADPYELLLDDYEEGMTIEKYDESGTYYLFVVDIRRDAIMRSTRTVDGRTEEVYTKIKYLPYSVCTELRMKKANLPYIPYCG